MHPDLLHALGKERHAELLRQHQFRHNEREPSPTPLVAGTRPVRRVRRSLGTLLVLAGARLLGGAPDTLDLFEARR
jgi:hypothetical protein